MTTRNTGTPGKGGKRQMSSPDSEEERDKRRARRDAMEKETEWMNENEKRFWQFIEKKLMKLKNEMGDEYMDTWILEEQEWERKLCEKDKRIEELEKRVNELEEMKMTGKEKEAEREVELNRVEKDEGMWSQVAKKKMKQQVVEALEDRKVQRKLVKVTEEAKEKKGKEKNIVIHGWEEARKKGLSEKEMKDGKKVGKTITSKFLESEVEAEDTEWYGNDEKKVLVLKMKSREDKSEILEKRRKLKKTKIYLDDDLTREERKVQDELLKVRKDLKLKDGKSKVMVRYRKICIDGKWLSWEKLKEKERGEKEKEGVEKENSNSNEEEIEVEQSKRTESEERVRFTFGLPK